MTQEDYNNLDVIIEGNSRELNAVESLILILNSPIAKRKGIIMTPEDCAEWSNDLKIENNNMKQENKERIIEFCKNNLHTHTDWTGTYVETQYKCKSVEDFINKLINYIEQ